MLYLHIGAHKTGTSSIQDSFFASRAALAERGVSYFGYSANHSQPFIWRFSSNRLHHPVTVNAGYSEADVTRMAAEIEDSLSRFLADPAYPTKIISGEEISVFKRDDVAQILAFVKSFNLPVRIIIYVRNYYDYLNSQIQELVKWGWTVEDLESSIASGEAVQPHFQWRIQKFIEYLGRENVDIRILHRDKLVEGDLLTDFCAAVGQPGLIDHLKSITANTSMSTESVRLVSEYNRLHPPRIAGRYNAARSENAKLFLMRKEGANFTLADPHLLKLFTTRIQQDGDYMRRLIAKDADGYLLNRPPQDNPVSSPNEPLARLKQDFDHLMLSFGRLLVEHESRKALTELTLKLLGLDPRAPAALEATRTGARAIRLDSDCRGLARTLLREGGLSPALTLAERAIELDPKNPENVKLLRDCKHQLATQTSAADTEA